MRRRKDAHLCTLTCATAAPAERPAANIRLPRPSRVFELAKRSSASAEGGISGMHSVCRHVSVLCEAASFVAFSFFLGEAASFRRSACHGAATKERALPVCGS